MDVKHELKVMWDLVKTAWAVTPPKCKYAIYGGLAVIAMVLLAGAARAENAPNSNFGMVDTVGNQIRYACYVSDVTAGPDAGTVYTCLVLQAVAPGIYAANGAVTFCTMEGEQAWACGKYEDMRRLSTGI